MVEVKFTVEEFEKLLKLVYLGNWVVNSGREEPDGGYDELEEKLFSLAEDAGLPEYADYDGELKSVVPSRALEQAVQGYLDRYNSGVFWEDLVLRLARRDLNHKGRYYPDSTDREGMKKWGAEVEQAARKYSEEFARHGLGNLLLRRPARRRRARPKS